MKINEKLKTLSFLLSIHYFMYKCFILKMFYTVPLETHEECYCCLHFFVIIFPDELCIFSRDFTKVHIDFARTPVKKLLRMKFTTIIY